MMIIMIVMTMMIIVKIVMNHNTKFKENMIISIFANVSPKYFSRKKSAKSFFFFFFFLVMRSASFALPLMSYLLS